LHFLDGGLFGTIRAAMWLTTRFTKSTAQRRSLAFRLPLVVAAALMLMAAFAPSAKADLIAYFNFEHSTVGGPPDFTSDSPPAFLGETTVISTNINSDALTTVRPGLALNRWPTDPDPNNLALGISRSAENNPGHLDIPLPTA
jgi:hypothetical protein